METLLLMYEPSRIVEPVWVSLLKIENKPLQFDPFLMFPPCVDPPNVLAILELLEVLFTEPTTPPLTILPSASLKQRGWKSSLHTVETLSVFLSVALMVSSYVYNISSLFFEDG
jgi:hypothetical protein